MDYERVELVMLDVFCYKKHYVLMVKLKHICLFAVCMCVVYLVWCSSDGISGMQKPRQEKWTDLVNMLACKHI